MTVILGAAPSQAEIDAILDGIYEKKPNVIWEMLRNLLEWLSDLFARLNLDGHIATFSPAQVAIIALGTVAVAAVIVVLAVAAFRRFRARNRSVRMPGGERITEFTMAQALEAYRRSRESGDFRSAVIWLFSAYLHSLSDKKLIVLHDSRTNRQYRSQLSSAGYLGTEFFDRFSRAFAELRFGGFGADEAVCDFWTGEAAPFLREAGTDV